MIWLKRWFFLLATIVSVTLWLAKLQAEVGKKADENAVLEMRRDILEIKLKLESMDIRQRQFFCRGLPDWCR